MKRLVIEAIRITNLFYFLSTSVVLNLYKI